MSQLADRFIKDPREVVKAGDIVKVRVVEVDPKRRRIALTMKLQETPAARGTQTTDAKPSPAAGKPAPRQPAPQQAARPAAQATSMAAAFAKLGKDA